MIGTGTGNVRERQRRGARVGGDRSEGEDQEKEHRS